MCLSLGRGFRKHQQTDSHISPVDNRLNYIPKQVILYTTFQHVLFPNYIYAMRFFTIESYAHFSATKLRENCAQMTSFYLTTYFLFNPYRVMNSRFEIHF